MATKVVLVGPLVRSLVCSLQIGYVGGRVRFRGGHLLGVAACLVASFFVDNDVSGLTAGATKG